MTGKPRLPMSLRCVLCGETRSEKFQSNTRHARVSYCLRCTERHRKSGGQLTQSERNATIRKGFPNA